MSLLGEWVEARPRLTIRQAKTKRLESFLVEPSREVEGQVLTLTIEVPHVNKRPLSVLAPNSDATPPLPARWPICSRRLARFRLPNAKSSAAPGIGHAEEITVEIVPELGETVQGIVDGPSNKSTLKSDPEFLTPV